MTEEVFVHLCYQYELYMSSTKSNVLVFRSITIEKCACT